jgi:hypothetical protein
MKGRAKSVSSITGQIEKLSQKAQEYSYRSRLKQMERLIKPEMEPGKTIPVSSTKRIGTSVGKTGLLESRVGSVPKELPPPKRMYGESWKEVLPEEQIPTGLFKRGLVTPPIDIPTPKPSLKVESQFGVRSSEKLRSLKSSTKESLIRRYSRLKE